MAQEQIPSTIHPRKAPKGSLIGAGSYNEVVDVLRTMNSGSTLPQQVKPPKRAGGGATRTVKVVKAQFSRIECKTLDGEDILVLMPDLFQHARWDNKVFNGVTMKFVDAQRVNATRPGKNPETWLITPLYHPAFGTGSGEYIKIAPLDEDGKPTNLFLKSLNIEWYDTNQAGRVWGVDIEEF